MTKFWLTYEQYSISVPYPRVYFSENLYVSLHINVRNFVSLHTTKAYKEGKHSFAYSQLLYFVEIGGQFITLKALPLRRTFPRTHLIGGWVKTLVGLASSEEEMDFLHLLGI